MSSIDLASQSVALKTEADRVGYFAFAMGGDRQAILGFFKRVLDASPIPVMIYNFP